MGLLSAELATKRLQAAHGTQDGIESISSWMLHHIDSIRVLADCWLNLFRTESEDRRVVLFYIMNDVVQRAKKKHVDAVCSHFEQPVLTAVSLARFSEKLRGVMGRCLKLIGECKAFSKPGIEKMNRMIADPNGDTDDGSYEIDVVDLAKKIEAFMQSIVAIDQGYATLKRAPLEMDEQFHTRMKDRKEGAKLVKETKAAIIKVERFREAVVNNNKRLYEFVDAIETAKRLFNMQLRDVAVVEDAYVKFGQGVREVQEEVEEMVRSGVYPAGSPPRDAPSPSAEDDVFAAGVEQVLNKMRPHDVTDEADMDVDDDDGGGGGGPSLPWENKRAAPLTAMAARRPSLVERATALAASMPALASHMGLDPRARAKTAAAAAAAAASPSPAKKPALDPAAAAAAAVLLQQQQYQLLQQQQAAAAAAAAAKKYSQPQVSVTYPGAATTVPPAYSMPPPPFTAAIPPPPPGVLNQYMVQPQQHQAAPAAAPPPLAIPSIGGGGPPPALVSPYSAPPPGYPGATQAATQPQQQYAAMQQQQQYAAQQHQTANQYRQPPPAAHYAPQSAAAAAAGGYSQPAAAAQQYGGVQQQQQQPHKYSTMPEYGRSNSNPGAALVSPTGQGAGSYYPMQATQTPGSSSSAAAAGTPYTPTAPSYRGRKGSEGGGGGGTPARGGGYGRGGGQYSNYGGGYGSQYDEQPAEDSYQPQYTGKQQSSSYDGQDSDYRQQQQQQQQYQPRGGRGYGRGGNRGGYARGGRGGSYGGGQQQQSYGGGGGYGGQGY